MIENFQRFLRQIKRARRELKYERKDFWKKNRVNFKNNIKTLVSFFPTPEGWNVSVVASYFLLDKESLPYDKDVWSFADLVGATEAQGKDMILFFNRADLEFLSAPALLPIVIHEMKHIDQAPKNTKEYVLTAVNDELSRKYEEEADAEVRKYSDEFRKENIIEKIMYCYDKKGWKGAKKMVDYLHKDAQDAFGGGYDQLMTAEEYKLFMKAQDESDVDLFLDFFIDSIEKTLAEEEKKKEELEKVQKESEKEEAKPEKEKTEKKE